MVAGVSPVHLLGPEHDLSHFRCGKAALDRWLRAHGLENQEADISRTYVTCIAGTGVVAGYHSLALSDVEKEALPVLVKSRLPSGIRYPIPVMLLARLAVDERHQSQKIGQTLLRDAVSRTLAVSEQAGLVALLVHALDDEAASWYETKGGFQPSPMDPLHLFLPLSAIRASIARAAPQGDRS
ncbi:MAG: GNAT family N-acetyltransferase [Candidatus Dormibacteria bacterium]